MARKSKRMIAAEQAAPLIGNVYNVAVYVRLSIEDIIKTERIRYPLKRKWRLNI